MKRKLPLIWLLLALAGSPGLLSGATLYANLPNASGWNADTIGLGFSIESGFAISNSFSLSAASVVQGVEFLSWNLTDDVILSVDWVISSGDVFHGYGTTFGSGTAAVSNSFQFVNTSGFDVLLNTFSVPNINLTAGDYFLTLLNAVTANSGVDAYWDVNDGPSQAWHNAAGSLTDITDYCLDPCTGSESFSITGTTSAVPEPTTLTLFGVGLAALILQRRKAQFN